jgi:hypothetical protein
MDIQPITYLGRTVAACTPQRVFLNDDLEARGAHDPLTRFVFEMCMYAGQILNGHLPGPYNDDTARAYARFMLIPAELLEHPGPGPHLNLDAAAATLGVPADELRAELSRNHSVGRGR